LKNNVTVKNNATMKNNVITSYFIDIYIKKKRDYKTASRSLQK